jgi:LacI family transcriptional regulator
MQFSAVSDKITLGAYLALKDACLSITHDVVIVGLNDEPVMSLMTPKISSVAQPAVEIGRIATRLFI